MTALTQAPSPKQARVFHNLSWEQLEEFDRSLEDIAGLKLVYLDGTLEIRTIGEDHENAKAAAIQ
jgi:hypothetical protein